MKDAFWKWAALGLIAAICYVGHGLHDSNVNWLPTATAQEAATTNTSEFRFKFDSLPYSKGKPLGWRAKVEGGWLVLVMNDGEYFGTTFVPDPDHSWRPTK